MEQSHVLINHPALQRLYVYPLSIDCKHNLTSAKLRILPWSCRLEHAGIQWLSDIFIPFPFLAYFRGALPDNSRLEHFQHYLLPQVNTQSQNRTGDPPVPRANSHMQQHTQSPCLEHQCSSLPRSGDRLHIQTRCLFRTLTSLPDRHQPHVRPRAARLGGQDASDDRPAHRGLQGADDVRQPP